MAHLSGLGIGLTLVFGCLLLALVGELYYLLWWKKQRITNCNSNRSCNSNSNSNRMEENYSNHTKEMFYLFCWDKPNPNPNPNPIPNPNPNPTAQNPNAADIEIGNDEEAVDTELMRIHNLAGPPRFLFTIKEESREDLESEDGKSIRKGSRTKSLSDLIVALDSQTPFLSPMTSPTIKGTLNNTGHNYSNPLFESSVEAELLRLRSSPPPKFKFLRDAEEKLYRKLVEEAQKVGILEKGNFLSSHLDDFTAEEGKNCSPHVLDLIV